MSHCTFFPLVSLRSLWVGKWIISCNFYRYYYRKSYWEIHSQWFSPGFNISWQVNVGEEIHLGGFWSMLEKLKTSWIVKCKISRLKCIMYVLKIRDKYYGRNTEISTKFSPRSPDIKFTCVFLIHHMTWDPTLFLPKQQTQRMAFMREARWWPMTTSMVLSEEQDTPTLLRVVNKENNDCGLLPACRCRYCLKLTCRFMMYFCFGLYFWIYKDLLMFDRGHG